MVQKWGHAKPSRLDTMYIKYYVWLNFFIGKLNDKKERNMIIMQFTLRSFLVPCNILYELGKYFQKTISD